MNVNPTLAQGLEVLTAVTSDKATTSKTASGTDDLVKIANGISIHASNVSKQAFTVIGNALLGRSDLNGSFTDEDLHQIARLKAVATGSSWGVEAYDSLDEMPSDIRPMWEGIHARQKEHAAKLDTIAGMHHWDRKVANQVNELMGFAIKDMFNSNFENALKSTVAAISENANVTGDIIVKNDDGTWSWGNFEVRDKDTGALYFNHDGNGKAHLHDKGMIFSELDTKGGGSWSRYDRAGHEKVFGY